MIQETHQNSFHFFGPKDPKFTLLQGIFQGPIQHISKILAMGLEALFGFGDKILSVNHGKINVAIGISTGIFSLWALFFVFTSLLCGGQELGMNYSCECTCKFFSINL